MDTSSPVFRVTDTFQEVAGGALVAPGTGGALSQRVAGITADMTSRGVEAGLVLLTARALPRLTFVCVSAGVVICPKAVARQAAPPAPNRVDTNLLLTAVINIRAALVNISAILAVTQVFVARLAG